VFPLTRPTLNSSSDPRNIIASLSKKKKSNLFQKYRKHLCICNQSKDTAVLYVWRGPMDTGNKIIVQFNENSHNCAWICNVFTWTVNKIKKKLFPTYLPFFHNVSENTAFFWFDLRWAVLDTLILIVGLSVCKIQKWDSRQCFTRDYF
jgi:hypothetical protein